MRQYQMTELQEKVVQESTNFQRIADTVSQVIVGNKEIIQDILIAILCKGHVLLEGVPGVAKTTLSKAITKALGLSFNRIQFTPDLLPSDLLGTLIFNYKTQEFETRKGPIFANLILADEINRAPAKVQSALLEAMQERQVTIGSTTHYLEEPFLVFATQNPLESEGTYRLPEAQVDRFFFKLIVSYPTPKQEKEILANTKNANDLSAIITREDIFDAQELVNSIYCDEKIIEYIISLVTATRDPLSYHLDELKPLLSYGASPRGTRALFQAAKAHAFLQKRYFVIPDDVKAVIEPALAHRIILSYEAEAQELTPSAIIKKILTVIPSP